MKKNFGSKAVVAPLPVLMIATYNEDGTPDVMNAAWGGQCGVNLVAVNLGASHATTDNIKRNNAFTLSIANKSNLVAADFVGIVSAKKDSDKMAKSGLHTVKSENVNAPVVEEFPLTMECKVVSVKEEFGEVRVVGEIVNLIADDSILDENDKVDLDKLQPLVYDSPAHLYRVVGEKVGNAFKDGFALK